MKFWNFALIGMMLIITNSANAALVSRLGGLAYYDTEADLTWLADANYAETTNYHALDAFGRLSWEDANTWANNLNIGGITGWRLPDTVDVSCTALNCTTSEMGNLFYNVLGGTGQNDINLSHNSNYDLFSNISNFLHWSATESVIDSNNAFGFSFGAGSQATGSKIIGLDAWAVRSGDVSAVPVPAAIWLFCSGLIGLVSFGRLKK